MKTKIGYKVMFVEGDKLVSTWAEGVFKKEYKVGEWTEEVHETLPLVLFDDEDIAWGSYMSPRGDSGFRCFKCEYAPSRQETLTFAHVHRWDCTMEEAIEGQKIKNRIVNRYPHVVLAKRIKLIEEVTR